MTVLRVELEIDSDVYPELYAQLVFIGRAQARGERVRQLAATGLVWEAVRMHGVPGAPLPAALQAPPAPATPVPTPARPAPAPSARGGSRAAPRAAARAPAPRNPAPAAGDFVDLGISAMPAPESEPASAASRLPVLVDVVDTPSAPIPLDAPPAPPSVQKGVTADHVDAPALEAATHRSGPRSRLIRMKERGLFKNG